MFLVAASAVAVAPLAYSSLSEDGLRPSAQGAEDLIGTYIVEVPRATGEAMAGRWRVTLAEGGVVAITPPAGYDEPFTTRQSYEVESGELETNLFLDAPGCQRRMPDAYVGRYTWQRSGSIVEFDRVADSCAPRRVLFDAPWQDLP